MKIESLCDGMQKTLVCQSLAVDDVHLCDRVYVLCMHSESPVLTGDAHSEA